MVVLPKLDDAVITYRPETEAFIRSLRRRVIFSSKKKRLSDALGLRNLE